MQLQVFLDFLDQVVPFLGPPYFSLNFLQLLRLVGVGFSSQFCIQLINLLVLVEQFVAFVNLTGNEFSNFFDFVRPQNQARLR